MRLHSQSCKRADGSTELGARGNDEIRIDALDVGFRNKRVVLYVEFTELRELKDRRYQGLEFVVAALELLELSQVAQFEGELLQLVVAAVEALQTGQLADLRREEFQFVVLHVEPAEGAEFTDTGGELSEVEAVVDVEDLQGVLEAGELVGDSYNVGVVAEVEGGGVLFGCLGASGGELVAGSEVVLVGEVARVEEVLGLLGF